MKTSGMYCRNLAYYNPNYDIDGASSKLDIPELIRVACRGGWPATLQLSAKASMMIAKDHVLDFLKQRIINVFTDMKYRKDVILAVLDNL